MMTTMTYTGREKVKLMKACSLMMKRLRNFHTSTKRQNQHPEKMFHLIQKTKSPTEKLLPAMKKQKNFL